MQVSIRKMGNSQGMLIPKSILKQLGLVDVADLQVNGDVIAIHPLKPIARAGWAQSSQRLAQTGVNALDWLEVGLAGDAELTW